MGASLFVDLQGFSKRAAMAHGFCGRMSFNVRADSLQAAQWSVCKAYQACTCIHILKTVPYTISTIDKSANNIGIIIDVYNALCI